MSRDDEADIAGPEVREAHAQDTLFAPGFVGRGLDWDRRVP